MHELISQNYSEYSRTCLKIQTRNTLSEHAKFKFIKKSIYLTRFNFTTGGVANNERASAPEKNCRRLKKEIKQNKRLENNTRGNKNCTEISLQLGWPE